MKFLLRLIALPVLLGFIIAFPLSLVLRNLGSLVFEAETTKALVHESLMNSEMARTLARQGAQQMVSRETGGEEISTDLLARLTEEDWRQITEIIASRRVLSGTFDGVIDSFSEWLDDADADFPKLQVDLSAWKASTLQNTETLAEVLLNALPPCETVQAGASGLQASLESLPACRPPEPEFSQVVSQSSILIQRVLDRAPDNFDLGQITQGAETPQELIELKSNLLQLRFWLGWGWLAVLTIGVVAAWLASAGLRSFLGFLGWPLLLAGGLALGFGLAVFIFQFQFLSQLFALTETSPALTLLGGAVAGGALQLIGAPLIFQGLVTLAAGAGAVVYARALGRTEASPGIPINRKRIRL